MLYTNIITNKLQNYQWLGLFHNNMLWKHKIESSELEKKLDIKKYKRDFILGLKQKIISRTCFNDLFSITYYY